MATNYKKNIIYNSIYRITVILSPLITSPYLSRVLGPEQLGIYSYLSAFATYFVIFSVLGVSDYGNRAIAKVRDDKNALSECFWQIYYIQFFLTIVTSIVYVFVTFCLGDYVAIRLILLIQVLSSLLEINWFAFGLEEFKLTSIRSIFVRIFMVIAIFIFVKDINDLWKYALIMVLSNVISLIAILPLIPKKVSFQFPDFKKIRKHILPNLILFLPVIATSIYQQIAKIMLGIWHQKAEVGFYQNAENIVTLPMFLTTAVVTVMLPYTSNMVVNGEYDSGKQLLYKSLKYTSILNIGMAFGLKAVASNFVPWYLGEEYIRSAELLEILSPIIMICGFSNVIRYQFLIPYEHDRVYLISIFMGAVSNVICNLILIPIYGAEGAAYATVLAYGVVLILQTVFTRKEIDYVYLARAICPYITSGIIMNIIVEYLVIKINIPVVLKIIVGVLVGVAVYLTLTIITLDYQKDTIVSNLLSRYKKDK